MSKEGCNIPGRMKRIAKIIGDTQEEDTKKINGVQEAAIGKRDIMKTRREIRFARKPSKQLPRKTCQKKGIMIKVRSNVTQLIEII